MRSLKKVGHRSRTLGPGWWWCIVTTLAFIPTPLLPSHSVAKQTIDSGGGGRYDRDEPAFGIPDGPEGGGVPIRKVTTPRVIQSNTVKPVPQTAKTWRIRELLVAHFIRLVLR